MNFRQVKKCAASLMAISLFFVMDINTTAEATNYSNVTKVGFRNVDLSNSTGGHRFSNAIQLALEMGADKVDNLKFTYVKGPECDATHFIRAFLYRYDLNPHWRDSTAFTSNRSEKESKKKWKDSSGKEHTEEIIRHYQVVVEVPGGWEFAPCAEALIQLVDANGNVLYSYKGFETDDSACMDSWKHLVRAFYKGLQDDIEKSQKK